MENNSFTETLLPALDEKALWYDNEELPKILENYRLLHTCVKNIYEFLLKKSMITADPYKLDKKISDIVPPETSQFSENERSVIMGTRFSDYDSTLDFLCNYYKFSVAHLTLPNIKKLVDFNNAITWNSFSLNSGKINTRYLATMVLDGKQNSDALTQSMLNDSLSKASKAMTEITAQLKDLSEFQKEFYKGTIRRNVFAHPGFDSKKALESPESEMQMIKKCYKAAMGKSPFYTELIEEIIQEDVGSNRDSCRQKVLDKLQVAKEQKSVKEKKVDTKAMLMDSLVVLGALSLQLEQIMGKLQENNDILESEHNSFMDKLKRVFRKAFNIEEKPLFYTITIVDQSTGAKRHERLNFHVFVGDLGAKMRRFASISQRTSPGYKKIFAMSEDKILDFIATQISDCNKLLVILNSLDDYFKSTAAPANKSKIKGLKMEITTMKNSVVKANQHKAEYVAYIEEEEQMKKLGITD